MPIKDSRITQHGRSNTISLGTLKQKLGFNRGKSKSLFITKPKNPEQENNIMFVMHTMLQAQEINIKEVVAQLNV